ncbi:MAG: histidine utilization repressor [Proteobacteria bacterium]|nr:histidine utilization repressor [Pseudomonadota bacterium]
MSTPIYQTVKDYIREKIESGLWIEKERIPSENELVSEFGASRMTINRAFRELTMEGWLYRVKGLGTFVAKRKIKSELLEIKNIADEIKDRGGRYSNEIEVLAEENIMASIAESLDLSQGARAFHSVIVHKEDGLPIQLADRWVNPHFAPDYLNVDFNKTTPNEYLTQTVPFDKVNHTLEAIMPDQRVQKYLKITASEPCLLLHRRTMSNMKIITYAALYHPGSRYKMGVDFEIQT